MADGGSFTQTGVTEMRRAVEQLPSAVTAALRKVAQASANAILVGARRRLLSPAPPLKCGRVSTAAHVAALIEVVEDLPNKQYRVISNSPSGTPGNDVLWIEYGTQHQVARPYMTPTAKDEEPTYLKNSAQAAADAATKVLG